MTYRPTYRSTYHHGDARTALIRAALALARRGGPARVTLRAAAREVGITATAVYRHFATADELLAAVKGRALGLLADRVDAAARPVPAAGAPLAADTARLRAAAEGYLAFARECPGLFAMACHGGADAVRELMSARLGGPPALVSVGGSPEPARPSAAGLAVWSVVHGVAILAVDGSLRGAPEDEQRACLAQVLDLVLAGVGHLAGPQPYGAGPAAPAGSVAAARTAVAALPHVADPA